MTPITYTKETADQCELIIIELSSENPSIVPQMPTTQSSAWTKPVVVLVFLSNSLL